MTRIHVCVVLPTVLSMTHVTATIAVPRRLLKTTRAHLFLGLACCFPQATSVSDTSLHAANECVYNHNTAQLDKDLRCDHLCMVQTVASAWWMSINKFRKFASAKTPKLLIRDSAKILSRKKYPLYGNEAQSGVQRQICIKCSPFLTSFPSSCWAKICCIWKIHLSA